MTAELQYTDLLTQHLPISQFVHQAITEYHQFPLWNSHQFSGQPFVGDPLALYAYPPYWLTYLFPYPITFNLLIILHMAWTGLGIFCFSIRSGLGQIPAWFAVVLWMGFPRLVAYFGAGQLMPVFAVAWLPWLLFSIHSAYRPSTNFLTRIAPGVVLGLMINAAIQWSPVSASITLAYSAFLVWKSKFDRTQAIKTTFYWMSAAFCVSASLVLPLIDFLPHTSRAAIPYTESAIFPLTWQYLTGLLFPLHGVFHEYVIYLGTAPLLLAGLAFRKRYLFWWFIALFSFLFALGPSTPFHKWVIDWVPFTALMRASSRIWFLTGFALIILAAHGLDDLLSTHHQRKLTPQFHHIAFALNMIVLLLALGVAIFFPPLPRGMLAAAIFLPLATAALLLLVHRPTQVWIGWAGLALVLVADLVVAARPSLTSTPQPAIPAAISWLEDQPGLFRVYSPQPQILLTNRLQTAVGYNPTHYLGYAQYIRAASGIHTGDYSVTVPDLFIDPNTPAGILAAASQPDLAALGDLNVSYLLLDAALPSLPAASPLFSDGSLSVFLNPSNKARIMSDPGNTLSQIDWSPNQIRFQVDGSGGSLILREIYHPAWKAWVNGQPQDITTAAPFFIQLNLPPGSNNILIRFVPLPFYIGLAITLLFGLFCALFRIKHASKA